MGRPTTEHRRDWQAFWDPRAEPGEVEPLEHWDYQNWGIVGSGDNKRGVGQFHAWCAAPRPGRQSWHTELHTARLSEQKKMEETRSKMQKQTHTQTHTHTHTTCRKKKGHGYHNITQHAPLPEKKGRADRQLGQEP